MNQGMELENATVIEIQTLFKMLPLQSILPNFNYLEFGLPVYVSHKTLAQYLEMQPSCQLRSALLSSTFNGLSRSQASYNCCTHSRRLPSMSHSTEPCLKSCGKVQLPDSEISQSNIFVHPPICTASVFTETQSWNSAFASVLVYSTCASIKDSCGDRKSTKCISEPPKFFMLLTPGFHSHSKRQNLI